MTLRMLTMFGSPKVYWDIVKGYCQYQLSFVKSNLIPLLTQDLPVTDKSLLLLNYPGTVKATWWHLG